MNKKEEKTIYFKTMKMINMGNGKESIIEIEKMKNRLEYGYSYMSGLQQGHPDMNKKEIEEHEEIIKDVLRDIAASFGYKIEIRRDF